MRSLLVFVRSAADLPRACAELSEFLAFRRQHDAAAQETLLGLWVDPRSIERIPSQLRWHPLDGNGATACIREAAGVDGIWMLCWLDAPERPEALSRQAVLAALAAAVAPFTADPPPAFVPVFGLDVPAAEVQAELQRLADLHADLVLAPILQHPGSGRLETQTWHQQPGQPQTQPSRRGGLGRQLTH